MEHKETMEVFLNIVEESWKKWRTASIFSALLRYKQVYENINYIY